MRIVNKTAWRTDHLRAFISRVAETEFEPWRRKRLRVDVDYRRGLGDCRGYAWINSNFFQLRLPREDVDRVDLALTIAHELAHCRGLDHKDMRGNARYSFTKGRGYREVYAWADGLPLEKRNPKLKVRPSVSTKVAHAEAKVVEWERRLKKGTTILKKWRRRVRDLKRRIERSQSQPKGE